MTQLGYNPEAPSIPDFSQKETPAQREARIQSELLKITTRLGGTDLTPVRDNHLAVNKQKRSGGQNYHSEAPSNHCK